MGGGSAQAPETELSADGVVIADRYELVSQLGVGGMGIVWRARDRRLGRAVAVKLLSKTSVGSDLARTRLIREARAAAVLEHEGIIRVYDLGETDDGGAFLVMELVRGRSLRAVLEQGTMKLGSRAAVIVKAARALQFAHDAGIVHRDVKPDNIMIGEDGRVIVVDFGVAKPISTELVAIAGTVAGTPPGAHLTGPGQLVGTPAYLAPEQARGLPIGAATDQFALAVTAFEAFTGQRPWTGTAFSELIASLLRDAPPPVSSVAPLPLALDEVFSRALAKEHDDRYADIGAFADALEDAAESLELDEVLSSRAMSRQRRLAPLSGREPAPAATVDDHGSASGKLTSTKISPADAAGAARPSTPRARFALVAVLATAIVGAVVWSVGHTAQPASALTPARATPSGASTPAEATPAEAPPPEAPPAEATPALVATATASASASSHPSSAAPPHGPRAVALLPIKEPERPEAPPAPSIGVAPLTTGTPSAPLASAPDEAPAPKPTGRRVRTEL